MPAEVKKIDLFKIWFYFLQTVTELKNILFQNEIEILRYLQCVEKEQDSRECALLLDFIT